MTMVPAAPGSPSSEIALGSHVFLDYDVVGEPWHERIVLAAVGCGDYVIVTPDMDVYVESITTPPLGGFRLGGQDGHLPIGLGVAQGRPVYRFQAKIRDTAMQKLMLEAKTLAEHTRRADPARYPDVVLPVAVGGASRRAPALWVCMDPSGEWDAGDVLSGLTVPPDRIVGDRALVDDSRGNVVLVQKILSEDVDAIVDSTRAAWSAMTPRAAPKPSGFGQPSATFFADEKKGSPEVSEDARTLPVLRNSAGERFRDVKGVAEHISEVEFADWPLQGPRTAKWWWTELSRSGLGPVARHTTWKHENNLKDEEALVVAHEMISEFVELLGCVDQCDVPNLAAAEAAIRHLQYTEFEVKKKIESKQGHSGGSEHFLGRHRRLGGALICPTLLRWVSDQSMKDSQILKEQRKAAEEKALLRGGKK